MENKRIDDSRLESCCSENNVGSFLSRIARQIPEKTAIYEPVKKGGKARRGTDGKRIYRSVTFAELDRRSSLIAAELHKAGLKKGMKIVLMVRYGIDFITLVYALFKVGAVLVMIDPGMGLKQMIACLREAKPDGFAAIPAVHAYRIFNRSSFPAARFNLTVGPRWFWGGLSYGKILNKEKKRSDKDSHHANEPFLESVAPDDPTAIIFTSGSTGPAKGVLYTHRIVSAQVTEIQKRYGMGPGETDLAAFPFFGLFNAAMGTTTIIPDMDPTHPALVNPELWLESMDEWKVTESFASPALWNRVIRYCKETGKSMPTLKRAISAGAPFPVALLDDFLSVIHPEGELFTPYGATESLPVASIGAREILRETASLSREGKGTCVGKRFSQIRWGVIPITDEPIESLESTRFLPLGEVGELIVTGPQVTRRYVTRLDANPLSKIKDKDGNIWHRIGDVGRLDEKERFWFYGRKAHRVETPEGPLFSIPCEAIVNNHPRVFRSALAGYPDPANPRYRVPVLYIEPKNDSAPKTDAEKKAFLDEIRALAEMSEVTRRIRHFAILSPFPVDVRHNAKINRELLSVWTAEEFGGKKN